MNLTKFIRQKFSQDLAECENFQLTLLIIHRLKQSKVFNSLRSHLTNKSTHNFMTRAVSEQQTKLCLFLSAGED